MVVVVVVLVLVVVVVVVAVAVAVVVIVVLVVLVVVVVVVVVVRTQKWARKRTNITRIAAAFIVSGDRLISRIQYRTFAGNNISNFSQYQKGFGYIVAAVLLILSSKELI